MKKYKVLEAKHIDTHHYHGSWFVYDWELKLVSIDNGIETYGTFHSEKMYKNLEGKTIILNEKNEFSLSE